MKKLAGALLIITAVLLFCLTGEDDLIAGGGAGILFGIGFFNIAF